MYTNTHYMIVYAASANEQHAVSIKTHKQIYKHTLTFEPLTGNSTLTVSIT